jgi:hypothetical protein
MNTTLPPSILGWTVIAKNQAPIPPPQKKTLYYGNFFLCPVVSDRQITYLNLLLALYKRSKFAKKCIHKIPTATSIQQVTTFPSILSSACDDTQAQSYHALKLPHE